MLIISFHKKDKILKEYLNIYHSIIDDIELIFILIYIHVYFYDVGGKGWGSVALTTHHNRSEFDRCSELYTVLHFEPSLMLISIYLQGQCIQYFVYGLVHAYRIRIIMQSKQKDAVAI